MVRIIDRRFDSKNKSAVEPPALHAPLQAADPQGGVEAIHGRSIRDLENGESRSPFPRDLSEPAASRQGRHVGAGFPGNDQFSTGDRIKRPLGGGGDGAGKGKASQDGEHEDDFVFQLSREEFLDLFFEDLELPRLIRTQLAKVTDYKTRRAGFTSDGVPANINIVRSMRGALGRRLALGSPWVARIRDAAAGARRGARAWRRGQRGSARPAPMELAALRARIDRIPFIDRFDLRYNNRVRGRAPPPRR